MRRLTVGPSSGFVLGVLVASNAVGVEVESKASKLELSGRVHAMWSHSTIDSDPSSEFLIRRARLTLKLNVNDWVSGIVEPDFAPVGQKVDLKDAYFKMEPSDWFAVIVGQTKRRFDLFELTSSTQMLIIERDGRIGRQKVPSYSFLTESLGFADRDIGLFVMVHDEEERVSFEAGLTNGSGANTAAQFDQKAVQARFSVRPLADADLELNLGGSAKPFNRGGMSNVDTDYSYAWEGSADWGNFQSGPHVQAGVVVGTNHNEFDLVTGDLPSFTAVQGIATYKHALDDNNWFEAIEPVLRLSFADPNTGEDTDPNTVVSHEYDGGILVTPGVNLFIVHRTRLALNADIFFPQAADGPMAPAADTEVGVKAATWLYW